MLAGTKIKILKASPVNPAIALGIIFWNKGNWKNVYIFTAVSFGGSALALIFFRYVYQKTTETMEEIEEEEEENNEEGLLG